MNHYRHVLEIEATPAAVYAALTTAAGIRGWWTPECRVDAHVGGSVELRFGRNEKDLRIERLEINREVRWLCVRARIVTANLARESEWEGTQIVFRLAAIGAGRTQLDFEHIGLEPSLECYDLCREGWDFYLGSLQRFLATGSGSPYALRCAA